MHGESARLKELKVTIPAELHLLLLRRKILHGETIGESVEAALRAYFAQREAVPTALPDRNQQSSEQPA